MSEGAVHLLGESLLPVCTEAAIQRRDPLSPAEGYTATPVPSDVTCHDCLEWMHS